MDADRKSSGAGSLDPPRRDLDVPRPGDTIDSKYLIEETLGAGGMGVVVAARHLQLGRAVAIKFMRSEFAYDKMAVERFLREARAAVGLSSAHVARVLDVGTTETGAPYMVMEYLEGRDLGEMIASNGPMPIAEAVDTVLQACEAIAEAHAHGIVHRDLKPPNLFVTTGLDGRPFIKVLDFGISKGTIDSTGSGDSLTLTGAVIGSPGYMSPEQIRDSKSTDARADVWALGVILYELLAGVAPFAGNTTGETFARIFSDEPAPIRSGRAEVPLGLEEVVFRCLVRDPRRRVQSVAQLTAMLAPYGSPGAALLVDRIAHIAGHCVQTVDARDGFRSTGDGALAKGSGRVARSDESGPSWLRSATQTAPRRRSFGLWVVLGVAAGGIAVVAALGAAYVGRRALDSSAVSTPSGKATPPAMPTLPDRDAPTELAPPAVSTMTNPEAARSSAVAERPGAAPAPAPSIARSAWPRSVPATRPTSRMKTDRPPASTNTVPDFGY